MVLFFSPVSLGLPLAVSLRHALTVTSPVLAPAKHVPSGERPSGRKYQCESVTVFRSGQAAHATTTGLWCVPPGRRCKRSHPHNNHDGPASLHLSRALHALRSGNRFAHGSGIVKTARGNPKLSNEREKKHHEDRTVSTRRRLPDPASIDERENAHAR